MGTTLADHFSQLGGKHSVLRNADGHKVNWLALPMAAGIVLAGAFDN
jgi:hypothetical protein